MNGSILEHGVKQTSVELDPFDLLLQHLAERHQSGRGRIRDVDQRDPGTDSEEGATAVDGDGARGAAELPDEARPGAHIAGLE
jgi:hypothetical protein